MGCFSWICKECGKAILSSSFDGQRVKLFLLKDGKVVQQMEGDYDSYGRVFIDGTQHKDVKHELRKSVEWEDPFPERRYRDIHPDPFVERSLQASDKALDNKPETERDPERKAWSKVCDLLFSENKSNGMAAIHSKCFTGEIPTTCSEDDPNQGWGDEGEYFFDTGKVED